MTWLRTIFVAAAATTVILSGPLSAPVSADGVKALVSGAITGALARLDRGLPHVAARFAERQPVKIVAFGSSSTEGAGASSPAKTYPSRLNEVLRTRFPGIEITVENQGVGGEDAEEMLARLDRVIASKPDLILWQVGTNAVLAGLNLAE